MATVEKTKISDDTKLAELTAGNLKTILRDIVGEIVEQAVFELEQQLPDPDAGKKLKPEIRMQLWEARYKEPEGTPIDEVLRELGLDEQL